MGSIEELLNTVMKLQVSQKAGHFYPTEQLSAFP
jgi:hypothetical protein